MSNKFTPLVTQKKHPRPLSIGLFGDSDSGKTHTALKFARYLGGRWAFVDADGGRVAEKADEFETEKWLDAHFIPYKDCMNPLKYLEVLNIALEEDYDGIIFDTLTIFWLGIWDKVQDRAEELAKKYNKESPMMAQAWAGKDGGNKPFFDFMRRIPSLPIHMIATLREKLEWSTEGGALKPTGVKLPDFRAGNKHMYEFTLFGWLERLKKGKERQLTFDKTSSCRELEGRTFRNPGDDVMDIICRWRGIKPKKSSR